MKLQLKIALAVGAVAMLALPATVAAQPPEGVPPYDRTERPEGGEHPTGPPTEPPANGNGENGEGSGTPGPAAGLPEKAKAYGVRCAGDSREHVEGEKGTEFSRCVRDAARLQHQTRAQAYGMHCAEESREHVKGERGTAFSRCVKAMARAANLDIGPGKACAGLSKEHVKGEKGTEFSRCVRDAARVIRGEQQ